MNGAVDFDLIWRRIVESIDNWVRSTAKSFGYRDYMIARYLELLGSRAEVIELLKSFETELLPSIRCNTLKVKDCSYVINRLKRLGYDFMRIEWEGTSFKVIKFGNPGLGATHEFLLGMYYLYRGTASLLPPIILNPKGDDVVLDLAAAPGGKTTHLAQLMSGEGVIVAVDISRVRMRALRSNLERLGVRNVVAIRMDGRLVPRVFGKLFTRALLDAPCTAEGLIQIDRGRKVKTLFSDLIKAHRRQVELLNAALDSLVSNSYLVYSVCSIAPEECELVISEVLNSRDDVSVVPLNGPIKFSNGITDYFGIRLPNEVKYCSRVYPHKHGMEGFFICMLRKY